MRTTFKDRHGRVLSLNVAKGQEVNPVRFCVWGSKPGLGLWGEWGRVLCVRCCVVWRVNEVVWLKVSGILLYDKHQIMFNSLDGYLYDLRLIFYSWNVKVNELRFKLVIQLNKFR